tara:strand:+ start:20752 stop:21102 length:351 start_codon:yes stop_codon:yes gene_type:complete
MFNIAIDLSGSKRIFLKDAIVKDGMGEKTIIQICEKCKREHFSRVCEIICVEYIGEENRRRTTCFSGMESYEIQNLFSNLDNSNYCENLCETRKHTTELVYIYKEGPSRDIIEWVR